MDMRNSNNRNVIITLEQELLNSMKTCNVQKLDELIHEDLLFNIPNGQTISKSIDLDTYRLKSIKIDEISSSEQVINLIDYTAIVSVIIEMRGKFQNHILDGKYRVLRVWKKIDCNWKIIAGSSIFLSEAP
ncbi:nuclear transport factor 2 family protein [Aquimarina muelleri]|nr:nuclear transport factor 2 family protein [Aquimarina muelleri]MCX2761163.1 nuclear transport factor 2 family protein [Aquimarina muelleri]